MARLLACLSFLAWRTASFDLQPKKKSHVTPTLLLPTAWKSGVANRWSTMVMVLVVQMPALPSCLSASSRRPIPWRRPVDGIGPRQDNQNLLRQTRATNKQIRPMAGQLFRGSSNDVARCETTRHGARRQTGTPASHKAISRAANAAACIWIILQGEADGFCQRRRRALATIRR